MHYVFSEGYKPHLNGYYPIYTQTSLSDKITENTKEKGRREHMSFVGLTFFKDHIIGYGDTKSSRFVDGAFQDDKKRQRVLKIFKTRDYIVCTYDINSFKTVGEDSKEIFIEDWLKENMNEVTYPEDLFKRFHDYLMKHENLLALNEYVRFFAGYIEMGQRVYVKAAINKMELSIKRQYVVEPFPVYGGANEYVEYFNKNPMLLMSNEQDIKENIKQAVNKFDEELPYNPVGGDIIVKTWNPQK